MICFINLIEILWNKLILYSSITSLGFPHILGANLGSLLHGDVSVSARKFKLFKRA